MFYLKYFRKEIEAMKTRIRILLGLMLMGLALEWGATLRAHVAMEEPVREEIATNREQMSRLVYEGGSIDDIVLRPERFEYSVTDRMEERERYLDEVYEERDRERHEEGLVVLEDGTVLYMTLDDVKAHLNLWFSEEEIRQATLVTMAEDLIAKSQTIWAAHVWCYLNRVDSPRFKNDIISVLASPGQFTGTYTAKNLSKPTDPDVEWVVRDVLARHVYEAMGAPPEVVGRVLPRTHCYFKKGDGKYNYFYEKCWGGRYDPFSSPFNPYGS